MNKITVIYKHPNDAEAFEKYYNETHIPIAAKIPNVDHVEFTKFASGPDGGKPDFYRMAELYFVSDDVMMVSLNSAEGQAAAGDIANFASGGFHFIIGKV